MKNRPIFVCHCNYTMMVVDVTEDAYELLCTHCNTPFTASKEIVDQFEEKYFDILIDHIKI